VSEVGVGVVDEGDLWWPGWVYDMPLCALILQQKTAASSSGGGGGGGGRQNNATDRTELLGGDSWEVNREAQPARNRHGLAIPRRQLLRGVAACA